MSNKLRDMALNALDVKKEKVTVREWGDAEFEVRGLGMFSYNTLVKACQDDAGEIIAEKFYPALVIETAHDPETGGKVFSREDRDVLAEKSSAALGKIVKVALRLCGAEDGDAEKNSGPTHSGDTSSE